ncbi:phiSA1p31-related protein [Streptomyces achromogenes]|uniref:phiSA1p31-related protein n=1 Tax=Streptomyces achromogenes TaxID=67255 RepID=UPI0036FAF061
MTERFEVGQKVKHNVRGDAEVTYGPYTNTFGQVHYVVRLASGRELDATADQLSAIPEPPKFSVGDKVTSFGDKYTILAGPFQGHTEWYVVEDEDGKAMTADPNDLVRHDPEPIKVGDRVRVLRATYAEECHGLTGTVDNVDCDVTLDGISHPYHVNLDGRSGGVYASSVEPVDEPAADTYEYDGVTYDLSARYRDKDGDVWSFTGKRRASVPTVTMTGDVDNWNTIELIARNYGPLTRVTG